MSEISSQARPVAADIRLLYAARGFRGFGDGFAVIILPAYLSAVGYTPLSHTTRGFIHGPGSEGFIKLIADRERGVLIGGTTAGPAGGEMLGAVSVAVHFTVVGPSAEMLSHLAARGVVVSVLHQAELQRAV